jgi:hypothetical protein
MKMELKGRVMEVKSFTDKKGVKREMVKVLQEMKGHTDLLSVSCPADGFKAGDDFEGLLEVQVYKDQFSGSARMSLKQI